MATTRTLRLWASCCCHVGTDLRIGNRLSLAEAIIQSEQLGNEGGSAFEWDLALHLGDFSGAQTPPHDEEGEEVIRQFAVAKTHRREQFYCVVGNHDASGPDEPYQWWFRKWIDQIQDHADQIIVSAHHHILKETTVGSGPWEGYQKRNGKWVPHYHGYFPDGAPEGASYLYFVDGKPDARAFENYLAEHQESVALWLGGHTHTHPDDVLNGRSHIEQKWGTTFVNVASLSRHHAGKTTMPISRLFTLHRSVRPGQDPMLPPYL